MAKNGNGNGKKFEAREDLFGRGSYGLIPAREESWKEMDDRRTALAGYVVCPDLATPIEMGADVPDWYRAWVNRTLY